MFQVKQLWVSKIVSPREWKSHYQYNSYCFLNKDKEGIKVGFLVANVVRDGKAQYPVGVFPDGCFPLTDEEMYRVDQYCRGHNIHPFPSTEVKKQKSISSSSSSHPASTPPLSPFYDPISK